MVDTQITVYHHPRRSIMARQRRSYSREFKVEAVKLVTEKGYSVAEAARSLDIGETLLRSWKQALDQHPDQAFPGHGNLPAIEEELRQLRAENKRLQMERDILKKATAFFAKEVL
jgi:transposase